MCTYLTVLCFFPSFPVFSLIPSVQQASYAASSFSSVSYCVQQTKVAFTPEDGSATQGISVSVSNSFLSRHGNLPVPSVSHSLLFFAWKHECHLSFITVPPVTCPATQPWLCPHRPCTQRERACVVGSLWPKDCVKFWMGQVGGRDGETLAATLIALPLRHKLAEMSWPFYSDLPLSSGSAL